MIDTALNPLTAQIQALQANLKKQQRQCQQALLFKEQEIREQQQQLVQFRETLLQIEGGLRALEILVAGSAVSGDNGKGEGPGNAVQEPSAGSAVPLSEPAGGDQ